MEEAKANTLREWEERHDVDEKKMTNVEKEETNLDGFERDKAMYRAMKAAQGDKRNKQGGVSLLNNQRGNTNKNTMGTVWEGEQGMEGDKNSTNMEIDQEGDILNTDMKDQTKERGWGGGII